MPNDQDFSLIEAKKKYTAEAQSDCDRLISTAREKLFPSNVVKVQLANFFNTSEALKPSFMPNPKPPMKIKGVRIIKISCNAD